MAQKPLPIVWAENTGQNEWDPIIKVPLSQSVTSRNVHLFDGGLGTRRGGAVSVTITGVTAPINALLEYIPGQDETAAELFVVDSSGTTKILRCAAGSSFSNLTLADNVATTPTSVSGAVVNGKLYLAYDSTVNRLHVFDPGYSTSTVRRAGFALPVLPSPATTNGGPVGTYTDVARYYRVAWIETRSGVIIRRSNLSVSAQGAPDGAHAALQVNRPTLAGEGETDWEVYASLDNVIFYRLGSAGAASTTYADSVLTTDYTNGTYDLMPDEGENTPFPSVKCLGTDGNRLYGLGVWETTAGDSLAPKNGRFYFGPVPDSSADPNAVDDDERINDTTTLSGWLDLARNANCVDRGVTPKPVNNVIYAFQSSGIYAIYPTDSDVIPYRKEVVTNQVGNLAQQAIVMAFDRNGAPCCFFLDPNNGPYMIGGPDGLRWVGKDLVDTWATVNTDATTLTGWGLWFPAKKQVWFGVAVSGNNTPNRILVLDVTNLVPDDKGDLRGGWTVYDGDLANTRAGVLFSNTLSATRSRTKTPYTGGNSKLLRYDESVHQDDATTFQAYVQSGSLVAGTKNLRLDDETYLIADASSGVTVRQTLTRNAGDETRTTDLLLTADGSETIVEKKAEGAAMTDAWTLQVQLGDSAAQNVGWHFHQWQSRLWVESDR